MSEILLLDSFDRYPAASGVGGVDTVWSSGWGLTAGRYFGGKALRARSVANHGGVTRRVIDGFEPVITMGVAYRPETTDQCPIIFCSGPTGTVCLSSSYSGKLFVTKRTWGNFGYSDSDVIAQGFKAEAIVQNIWQYVEFSVNVTTGAMKGWVNGELCLDTTGYTWSNTTGFDLFGLAVRDEYSSFDDFYTRRGDEPLGEIKIETLNVTNTVYNDFTITGAPTAHQAINEVPVDGDTSFISSSVPNARAEFEMSNLTALPEHIRAVQVRSFARKNETEVRSIRQQAISGGQTTEGKEHYLGVGYKYLHDIFTNDPSTGQPWTNQAVNQMNFGVRIDK